MANEEHLETLNEGVETWNEWRGTTSETPDLHEANLHGADLSGAILRGVDLSEADLTDTNLQGADLIVAILRRADLMDANLQGGDLIDANLRGADLSEANLCGADLSEADLSEANLKGADLFEANLQCADLSKADMLGANLRGANLSGANLRGANLSGANLQWADLDGADLDLTNLKGTNLGRADLRRCNLSDALMGDTIFFKTHLEHTKGLNTITHVDASNLDHFTIAQSEPLPTSFLQGCGLPNLIIKNTKALRGNFYSCFISHSSDDQAFADRLYADLQDEGVRCWYAPQDLRGGEKAHRQIEEAIRDHDKLVVILSEASMESNWVEHEIREARERERKEDRQVLFPISLVSYSELRDWELFDADEGRDLAREVREYFIPDFSNWKDHDKYSEAFDKLFRGLKGKS